MPKHTKLYTFIEPVPIVKKPKIKLTDIFKKIKKNKLIIYNAV